MKVIPKEIIFTEEEINTMYSVLTPLYKWDTNPPPRARLIRSVALIFEKFYGDVKIKYSDGYIDGMGTMVYLGGGKEISVYDIIVKMVEDEILSTDKAQGYDIDGNKMFHDPEKTKPRMYTVYQLNKRDN